MENKTKKRVRRTKDQVSADAIKKLEDKIMTWRENIAKAEQEIQALRNPPKPSLKMKDISAKIKELDLPLDEVMKLIEKRASKS